MTGNEVTFAHNASVYGYNNPDVLSAVAAQRLAILLMESQANVQNLDKPFHLLITGGTDSIRMFQMLASNPLLTVIDWDLVHIWWADERFVAYDSEDRNARKTRESLLDLLTSHKALAESHIHEMPADERSAEEIAAASDAENDAILDAAARDYEEEITGLLGPEPVFDLAILGMGPDAHMASLFPGLPQVNNREHIVVGVNHSPKLPPMRLSLTVPVLAHSRRTWFLTAGAEKGAALMNSLSGANNPEYPASFANGTDEISWLTTAGTLQAAIE
ncbi:6-phosphogluconolactonase [Gardnerella vaginalis 6119V5]|uniref:6-phosphogluconolactonase n=1 Tax=Gardnerella vaginalis TaxID=2702 RepID=UPI000263586F|nr:6-phosphogluconolactonase [Gardnerella vaginalis]EIK88052.1 6-phosphogluconolactonase [Gardnerella vaginalis 6119V5]